jgi:ZIP family zinc transporter
MPALALLPFFSTLAGGMAALRFRHRLHPFMAFAAGVLVATAIADLLPEASDLVGGHGLQVAIAFLAGYLLFALLESFIHQQSLEHGHVDHDHGPGGSAAGHQRSRLGSAGSRGRGRGIVGLLPPSSLIVHSTLDGFAIGVAFQAGSGLGLVVLLAVLAHDFADGMNIVTLALDAARGRTLAIAFLVLDALAPVIGAGLSQVVAIPDQVLGWILAGFSGVFIAIGASHLLPESQHGSSHGPVLIGLTALGATIVLVVRSLAG